MIRRLVGVVSFAVVVKRWFPLLLWLIVTLGTFFAIVRKRFCLVSSLSLPVPFKKILHSFLFSFYEWRASLAGCFRFTPKTKIGC